jgi:hypothetical protein
MTKQLKLSISGVHVSSKMWVSGCDWKYYLYISDIKISIPTLKSVDESFYMLFVSCGRHSDSAKRSLTYLLYITLNFYKLCTDIKLQCVRLD